SVSPSLLSSFGVVMVGAFAIVFCAQSLYMSLSTHLLISACRAGASINLCFIFHHLSECLYKFGCFFLHHPCTTKWAVIVNTNPFRENRFAICADTSRRKRFFHPLSMW